MELSAAFDAQQGSEGIGDIIWHIGPDLWIAGLFQKLSEALRVTEHTSLFDRVHGVLILCDGSLV